MGHANGKAVTVSKDEELDLSQYGEEETKVLNTALTPIKRGSKKATERLISDLKEVLKKTNSEEGISVTPVENNLYQWHIRFYNFPHETQIHGDLALLKEKNGRDYVLLEILFNKDYPSSPPFVRVVGPRFCQYTGHVTIGGSICIQDLTGNGWKSDFQLSSFLVMIRHLLVEGNAKIDMNQLGCDYSMKEAKDAFDRVARYHGWT